MRDVIVYKKKNISDLYVTFGMTIQNGIFDQFQQRWLNVVVDRQRSGVDNAHVHASFDCVIQKHRMPTHVPIIIQTRNFQKNKQKTGAHIASRSGSLPRNENETFERPPLT
jgi:hypothetical protein